MKAWIDATQARADLRVFGMTLLERLLRALEHAGVALDEVRIATPAGPAGDALLEALPRDAAAFYPLSPIPAQRGPLEGLREAVAEGEPVLALSATTIVDGRVLAHLASEAAAGSSVALVSGEAGQRGAALRIVTGALGDDALPDSLLALADEMLEDGRALTLERSGFDRYIVSLRRDLEPWVRSVTDDAARREVERFLFWSNYKGSTDFMTRYVYPPFVWLMVRPLARWRVHPNWVTVIDIVATIAAIPFFMAGMWLPGFFCAYLMSVLDSVDGKLARVTYTSSKIGNLMDHGLDLIHPPFWYLAWGWALATGDVESIPYRLAVWMLWLYVADRLCAPIFQWRTGRSIQGYEPIDERMRTFISRRNVNLPVFTAAVLLDWWLVIDVAKNVTFGLIVLWQAVCLVFHAVRVVQCWSSKAPKRPEDEGVSAS